MFMSLFQAVDVMPYVQNIDLIVNGNEIVLTEEEQTSLKDQLTTFFQDARIMPAFGVITPQMYEEQIQDGVFVSLKFDEVLEINGLPFDELVFKVQSDFQGFNMARGINGVFQGRCIFIDLNGQNMQELADYINSIESVQAELENDVDDIEEDETLENVEIPDEKDVIENDQQEKNDQEESTENQGMKTMKLNKNFEN